MNSNARSFALGRAVLYGLLLALIFAGGAALRFRLPQWPLADPDTWGYLYPAISKLSGTGFQHTDGRNFLYPGFVWLVLSAVRDFRALSVVQHLLGLGTGVLLLLSWNQLAPLLRFVPRWWHRFLGLGMVAVYLLANRPIVFEHQIRPEGIAPFFALLNIYLSLLFFARWRAQGFNRGTAALACGVLVNSVLLVTIKTSFGISVLFSAGLVVVALFDRRATWRRRLAVLALGLAAALTVVLFERKMAEPDDDAHNIMAESLFTIHANLIVQQMDEDLARGLCPPQGCAWFGEVVASLHDAMARSWAHSHHYSSFGFDPDYLLFHVDGLHRWTPRFFPDYHLQMQFFRDYFWRTMRHRPGAMLRKITSQMAIFYRWNNPAFIGQKHARFDGYYQKSNRVLDGRARDNAPFPPLQEYLAHSRELQQTPADVVQSWSVRRANNLLAHAFLVVFLGTLALAVALLFWPGWRARYGPLTLLTLFLFAYPFGNSLGTAIVHSLHIHRYTMLQYSFTLLATCAGLVLLVDAVGDLLRRRKEQP